MKELEKINFCLFRNIYLITADSVLIGSISRKFITVINSLILPRPLFSINCFPTLYLNIDFFPVFLALCQLPRSRFLNPLQIWLFCDLKMNSVIMYISV